MSKKFGFDSIDDWFAPKTRVKKKTSSTGVSSVSISNSKPVIPKDFIKSTKAPEVMVKISGNSKDTSRVKSHISYIARNGNVELEDQDGNKIKGSEELKNLKAQWDSVGIPSENGKYREAFHIVLSMPPNTDPVGMLKAARNFASEEFTDHKYAMAQHLDEKHPHVHLVVMARDINGKRLNPRKNDLQSWREQFAHKLREQGISANATKRIQRLRYKKPENTVLRNMRNEAQGNFKNGRNIRDRDMPNVYKEKIRNIANLKEMPENKYEDQLKKTYQNIVEQLKSVLPKDILDSKDFKDYSAKASNIESTAEQQIFKELQVKRAEIERQKKEKSDRDSRKDKEQGKGRGD